MTPKGSLPYGAPGEYSVWYLGHSGRIMYVFDDEYLAMQYAVHVGGQVTKSAVNW